MARDALIAALRRITLLNGLTPLQITEIARRADRIVFKPGKQIITANEPADAAVVIISGTAERVTGPGLTRSPQPLPAGTILAEMAMLVDMVPTSTVLALSEVRALRLTREEMHRLLAEDVEINDHFLAKAAARLRHIAAQMQEIETTLAGSASCRNSRPATPSRTPALTHH